MQQLVGRGTRTGQDGGTASLEDLRLLQVETVAGPSVPRRGMD